MPFRTTVQMRIRPISSPVRSYNLVILALSRLASFGVLSDRPAILQVGGHASGSERVGRTRHPIAPLCDAIVSPPAGHRCGVIRRSAVYPFGESRSWLIGYLRVVSLPEGTSHVQTDCSARRVACPATSPVPVVIRRPLRRWVERMERLPAAIVTVVEFCAVEGIIIWPSGGFRDG